MLFWAPKLYKHDEDLNGLIVILTRDQYCTQGQVIAQPVYTLGKLCIAIGEAKRSWEGCFTEINK